METGYLAAEGLEEPLRRELKGVVASYGSLIVAQGPVQRVHWAQNIWPHLERLSVTSISQAAKALRERQKLWAFWPYQCIRRGELIREKLPYFSPKEVAFPSPLPTTPLGSWILLDETTLLCSAACSSPFAHGQIHFVENKTPPSRAYLKLWEALTYAQKYPRAGEVCLEVGASPGSWTWALQQLGAEVIAVDRAPLAPEISALARVETLKKDAFSLTPETFQRKLDWIFSDVICYPEKLLEWVHKWLAFNPSLNFVCTLKFQGDDAYDVISQFEAIEGSELRHLYHNKHELTWIKINRTSAPID